MIFQEKTVESTTVFSGKVFDIHSDKSMLSNGKIQNREVVIHSGGVAIVAECNEKILFVKQFRYGSQQIMTEIPAGKLNQNEDILDAAKRELEEETGFSAEKWTQLGYIYPTPAICSEKIYLFYAQNLKPGTPHPDDGEFVDFIEISKEKAFEMIKTGEISDAKTICALMRVYKL